MALGTFQPDRVGRNRWIWGETRPKTLIFDIKTKGELLVVELKISSQENKPPIIKNWLNIPIEQYRLENDGRWALQLPAQDLSNYYNKLEDSKWIQKFKPEFSRRYLLLREWNKDRSRRLAVGKTADIHQTMERDGWRWAKNVQPWHVDEKLILFPSWDTFLNCS